VNSSQPVGAADVIAAADCVQRALGGAVRRDWSAPVPHLSWTVAQTVAHAARAALWCAVDLAAGGPDSRAVRLEVDAAAGPEELLRTLGVAGRLTAYVLASVPPGTRGYDPDGPADASGFAAMCCDELLVHGWDAAQGLGVEIRPAERLAATVLGRLFPGASAEPDSWSVLLWANGRIGLPGRPKQQRWRWQVAPPADGLPG
jgi:uncharacterized protein (TIGR03083 family)